MNWLGSILVRLCSLSLLGMSEDEAVRFYARLYSAGGTSGALHGAAILGMILYLAFTPQRALPMDTLAIEVVETQPVVEDEPEPEPEPEPEAEPPPPPPEPEHR